MLSLIKSGQTGSELYYADAFADDEILFFSLFEKVLLKLLIDMFLGYILCSVHLFFFFFFFASA